ncbi:MAG: metallopeptidase family protein [Promicromonosporaceae bacterium]|nr:metallopeptidase family protein [Promicromonosporaceae bacterium]
MKPEEFAEREIKMHPEAFRPGGPNLSREEFAEAIADAIDALPPDLKEQIANVAVLVEDDQPPGTTGLLFGLYHGVPLPKRDNGWVGVLPDTITIYRKPIIAVSRTRADVVRRIAVTILHEIGHYFGIDDARLRELGWA